MSITLSAMMMAMGGAKVVGGMRSKRSSRINADEAIEKAYDLFEYNKELIDENYEDNVQKVIYQANETMNDYTDKKVKQLANTSQSLSQVTGVDLAGSSMPTQQLTDQLQEANENTNRLIVSEASKLIDMANKKEQQIVNLTYQMDNIDTNIMNGLDRAEQQANSMMLSGLLNVGAGAYSYSNLNKTPTAKPTQIKGTDYYDYVNYNPYEVV